MKIVLTSPAEAEEEVNLRPSKPIEGEATVLPGHPIQIRMHAAYDAELAGGDLKPGERARVNKQKTTKFSGKDITFYRLADGTGWIYDYCPAKETFLLEIKPILSEDENDIASRSGSDSQPPPLQRDSDILSDEVGPPGLNEQLSADSLRLSYQPDELAPGPLRHESIEVNPVADLTVGSRLEVYSSSGSKWCPGVVKEDKGDLLVVQYQVTHDRFNEKSVSRRSNALRVTLMMTDTFTDESTEQPRRHDSLDSLDPEIMARLSEIRGKLDQSDASLVENVYTTLIEENRNLQTELQSAQEGNHSLEGLLVEERYKFQAYRKYKREVKQLRKRHINLQRECGDLRERSTAFENRYVDMKLAHVMAVNYAHNLEETNLHLLKKLDDTARAQFSGV